jgi:hypothetical protein
MANLRSRVTQAAIGAVLVTGLGVAYGAHSVAATTTASSSTGGQTGQQASESPSASAVASPTATHGTIPTRVPPSPTPTPDCTIIPNTMFGSVRSVNVGPPETLRFRESNGCSYTVDVTSAPSPTAITVNGQPNSAFSAIQPGMRGSVQKSSVSGGVVFASAITVNTDN